MHSSGRRPSRHAQCSRQGWLSPWSSGNFQLATAEPLAGKSGFPNYIRPWGIGMAVSTIIILMLINGLAFKTARKARRQGAHYIGCGIRSRGIHWTVYLDGSGRGALAIPTSVIGGSLIPIAYFTFLLMMNSKKVLGEDRPQGSARIIWNVFMGLATGIATIGSIWVLSGKAHFNSWQGMIPAAGLGLLVILLVLGAVSFIKNEKS